MEEDDDEYLQKSVLFFLILQKRRCFKTGCTVSKRINKVVRVRSVPKSNFFFSKPKTV